MASKKLGVLCGGSGSSKFVSALKRYLPLDQINPTYIPNVGDNFWHYGVYICPDVDIVLYQLSDILDERKGWGIKNDSMNFLRSYSRVCPTEGWFNLGDLDLGFCLRRTELLRMGWKLSSIVTHFRRIMRVREEVIPATDDNVQTFVKTPKGKMHLQEFWVKNKGVPTVSNVEYLGANNARPSPRVLESISERVLILPANPVSSILPILSVSDIITRLQSCKLVIGVSPFLGTEPFSGPAAKFMRALNIERSSFGVAKLYSRFLKVFMVDKTEDYAIIRSIRDIGVECVKTDIRIVNTNDKRRIVNEIAQYL